VRLSAGMQRTRPRMNLAAPTPPASVVIRRRGGSRNRPRTIGRPFSVELLVESSAFHGDAAHLARLFLNQIDRHEFARVSSRLRRDALLHQGAGEVVASGLEGYRREIHSAFHPR